MAGSDILGGLGAFFGDLFGGGAEKRRQAEALWSGLDTNTAGELSNQYQTGPSAFQGMSFDPFYEGVQKEAISDLVRRGQSMGRDPETQAALLQAGNQMGARNRSAQQAIDQSMQAASGGGGGMGGAQLANKLMAQQGNYSQAQQAGTEGAALGMENSRQNLAAGMGGAFEGSRQDLARKQAINEAKDRIAMFNAASRRGAYQDAWDQRFGKAQGQTGVLEANAQMPGRLGAAAGTGLGAAADLVGGAAAGNSWADMMGWSNPNRTRKTGSGTGQTGPQ